MKPIATRPSIIKRVMSEIGYLLDTYQWLPLAIVVVLLLIVNTVDAP